MMELITIKHFDRFVLTSLLNDILVKIFPLRNVTFTNHSL